MAPEQGADRHKGRRHQPPQRQQLRQLHLPGCLQAEPPDVLFSGYHPLQHPPHLAAVPRLARHRLPQPAVAVQPRQGERLAHTHMQRHLRGGGGAVAAAMCAAGLRPGERCRRTQRFAAACGQFLRAPGRLVRSNALGLAPAPEASMTQPPAVAHPSSLLTGPLVLGAS